MHLKVIACEVAAREIYHCAARAVNTTDVSVYTQGLHNNSSTCRVELQRLIDAVPAEAFQAVLLGYGLCNNSIVGIRARGLPVVIPRAHDCITFFLGSKERYAQLFAERPGTYYYTSGWLEYTQRGGDRPEYNQNSGFKQFLKYQELVEKYGEENAQFLLDSVSHWQEHYSHGALITFPFTAHLGLQARVQAICREKGWDYFEIPGDLTLLQNALDGKWDPAHFLVLQPGQEVKARYDEQIIDGCPACGGCPA